MTLSAGNDGPASGRVSSAARFSAFLRLFGPVAHAGALAELAGVIRRYRGLTLEMTRRDLFEQYSGQVFGGLWVIVHPLFMIGLYIFVFRFVFKVRMGVGNDALDSPLDYTAYILSGLLPWLGCQTIMGKACTALVAQANLVKQVVFPIEVLVLRTVLASLVPQLIATIVLVVYVLTRGLPPATYLLLPLLLVVELAAMLGLAFMLAAIGVFLRDAKDLVQLFATAGIYVLPVFYLPAWVPAAFQPILYLNPFSYLIWCFQDALFFGRFAHPVAWLAFPVLSLLAMVVGYRVFRWLKPHYGSAL